MKLMVRPPTPTTVKRDVDALFDRFFRGPLFPELAMPGPMAVWEPLLDFSETEKEFLVRLEVPGFHRENLDVKYDGAVLTLTGHRELQAETKGEEYLWQEREEGRFSRSLRIPSPVEEAKIEASYENGVLMVRLPKLMPAVRPKIPIK